MVGAGFSAVTTVSQLLALRKAAPETRVTWVTRAPRDPYALVDGDILPQRRALSEFGNSITTAAVEGAHTCARARPPPRRWNSLSSTNTSLDC